MRDLLSPGFLSLMLLQSSKLGIIWLLGVFFRSRIWFLCLIFFGGILFFFRIWFSFSFALNRSLSSSLSIWLGLLSSWLGCFSIWLGCLISSSWLSLIGLFFSSWRLCTFFTAGSRSVWWFSSFFATWFGSFFATWCSSWWLGSRWRCLVLKQINHALAQSRAFACGQSFTLSELGPLRLVVHFGKLCLHPWWGLSAELREVFDSDCLNPLLLEHNWEEGSRKTGKLHRFVLLLNIFLLYFYAQTILI